MNLPAFTAGASCYKSSQAYHAYTGAQGGLGATGVVPAKDPVECKANCWYYYKECVIQSGGDPYGWCPDLYQRCVENCDR
jgi:hypothetical protein